MNKQKALPLMTDAELVSIHSIFYTIQGEGAFTGRPAKFVRFYGCNLQCPGCDTDYTSVLSTKFIGHPKQAADYVARFPSTKPNRCMFIVITGGEPFRQAGLAEFVRELDELGYTIQIETNGSVKHFDLNFMPRVHVTCSPKTADINENIARRVSTWKYILRAGEIDGLDGLPTSSLLMKQRPYRPYYAHHESIWVQPFDEGPGGDPARQQANIAAAVESAMKFGYNLSIQTHKIANLP